MSPVLSSGGSMVLATAMAVSGATFILLAINRLQKSTSASSTPHYPLLSQPLQSCIVSSDDAEKKGKGKTKKKKKEKRVHFAEDVVDPTGNSDEYRKLHTTHHHHHKNNINTSQYSKLNPSSLKKGGKVRDMPANRVALYNGILKDRVLHRVAYSH